jgi:hypothetical protein
MEHGLLYIANGIFFPPKILRQTSSPAMSDPSSALRQKQPPKTSWRWL